MFVMKKVILLIAIATATHTATAQRTSYHSQLDRLFNRGKEMFLEGNYAGAQDILSCFEAKTDNTSLKEEAAYMIAVSTFRRGTENSLNLLKEFLDTYPETIYRHRVNFLIGSDHYDKKEWETAIFRFKNADLDYLTPSEQEDYSFRAAYTYLQLGDKEEARRYFGLLSQNSRKYHDAADYYLAYIDYSDENYAEALRRFQRLREHSEYREEVAFYTTQATFFENRFDEAVRLSESFLTSYPQSSHRTEIFRILGNIHYRLGQPSRAVSYYENYLAETEKPLRGDAYFLGLSYFETGQYEEAVRMFQKAVGERDALTQNAQLQLGQTYLKMNRKQPAQMAFEAAARDKFDPKVRETAMFNYALLAHETNFSVFSESIALFENFLREYPDSKYGDQVNDILAETFLTTKDYQAALNAINRIGRPGRRILEAKQTVLFQLGIQEFINGNMDRAVQHFNSCIDVGNYDPQTRNSAYYWRGEAYYRMGYFAQAANDFLQFTHTASPHNEYYALGWYGLGYTRFKQQQYAQAANAFLRYVANETDRSRPEYADALNRVGDSHYFNRNFTEAERYYQQAADANPAASDYAAYQRAFVLGLQRNYPAKINALDDLMRRYPNSQYFDDALYEKSRALTMLNRENEAIGVLQRLVSDYPRSPLASQGGVQLGQLYYNIGNPQQSIAAYKNVIGNFPGSDDARNALVSLETVYRDINDVQSYVKYANSLPGGMRITASRQDSLTYLAAEGVYMKSSKADAEKAMQRYLQTYPNGAYASDANYYLAVISDEKEDKGQALIHFRRVIDASSPKFLDNALIYTSKTEYAKGNFRTALADYSRLANSARSAANRQTGQMGIVRTQSKLGGYHEAIKAATELLTNTGLSPEIVAEAHYLRAQAYRQTNETEKALTDFQFVANDTRSIYGAEAQFILAETFYRTKAYDRAEAQVKEFMQKGTPHQYWMARALIVLSDTYKAKGDDFQARQYMESLKSNYKGEEADIRQMINERLNN